MTGDISGITVGDVRSDLVVESLSRTQIVMYAGASGDYNPLHTDEIYAPSAAAIRACSLTGC